MDKDKKSSGHQDSSVMSKSKLKAYHKEICDFYITHGWRETLSHYRLSPKQGADVISIKVRGSRKAIEKEAKKKDKEKRSQERKAQKGVKAQEKKDQKGVKAQEKKDQKGVKAQEKKAQKSVQNSDPAKSAAKNSRRKSVALDVDTAGIMLDFLLKYRKQYGNLDDAIAELAMVVRAG